MSVGSAVALEEEKEVEVEVAVAVAAAAPSLVPTRRKAGATPRVACLVGCAAQLPGGQQIKRNGQTHKAVLQYASFCLFI